jgi:hypothetical protein
VPSFIRNTSGGKAVSGGALAPRSRRGNSTDQVASYWSGGTSVVSAIEYLVIAGGGGGGTFTGGGGGGAGGYRSSVVGSLSGANSSAEAKLNVSAGVAFV